MQQRKIFLIGCMIALVSACGEREQNGLQNLDGNRVASDTGYENASDLTKNQNKQPLTVSAYCTNNPQCVYSGQKEIPITIEFRNNSNTDIYIPLNYIRQTGPAVKLIDKKTGQSTQLPVSLARKALLEDLTLIPPGQKVLWEGERVGKTDLEYLGKPVDVLLEIGVLMNIMTGGKTIKFKEFTTLHIKSK